MLETLDSKERGDRSRGTIFVGMGMFESEMIYLRVKGVLTWCWERCGRIPLIPYRDDRVARHIMTEFRKGVLGEAILD